MDGMYPVIKNVAGEIVWRPTGGLKELLEAEAKEASEQVATTDPYL